MIYWKIAVGAVLFCLSGFLAGMICEHLSWSFVIDGKEYSEFILDKVLSAIGGSFVVMGVLKNPTVRR